MTEIIQQLVNGLSLGATYSLVALGLAIVFTTFGLINFAHGELITITSYVTYGLSVLGIPWAVAITGGLFTAIISAILMERIAFRPVRGKPPTTSLLTSFGVSLILQALIVIIVSPRTKTVQQWSWLGGSDIVGGLVFPRYQVITLVVALIALLAMVFTLKKTNIGLEIRGAAEDLEGVRLLGVRSGRLVVVAFAVSGLLAGIAAVLIMARTGGSINPHMGLLPMLSAFVAVVLGGFGSLGGAVLGGFILGFLEVSLRAWLPQSAVGLTTAIIFAIVILVLRIKPSGIMGKVIEEKV
ncbi:MAG TPA: branched-chain amino acid ABC transporter permease [Microbacteriaceae bacterium]|nr:branched-chain amino acid ABC transporter permease [Microbacteriaceae bacterium]